MSARKIVTSGASEIVVDDFIDTYLRERPKTIPELSLHQPPEPPPPPAPASPPAQASRFPRATRRGLGPADAARPPQAAAPRPVGPAPVSRAQAPRPPAPSPSDAFEAPDTNPDSEARATLPNVTDDGATARRLLAARDERISQLENELKKVKDDLERVRRDSDADVDGDQRTQIVRPVPAAPAASVEGGAVWRPAPPPRPGTSGRAIPPMVKTMPMSAVAPSPPANAPSPSHPSHPAPSPQEHAAATMMLAAVGPEPRAATPSSSSPSEVSRGESAPVVPGEDTASPTMVLGAVPDFGQRSEPPPGLVGYVPPPLAPPPAGSSGLTPAPFVAPEPEPPTGDSDASAETIVRAPPRKSRVPAIVALLFVVGAGAAGTFAFLRGMGPFAARTKTTSVAASAKPEEPVASVPKSSAARSPAAASPSQATSSQASAIQDSPAQASASATASSAPPVADPSPGGVPEKLPDATPATPEQLKTLLSFQAFLTVRSTADAAVILQGQDVGRTNQRLVVRCGPKNIRLRGPNAEWLSDGVATQITCMQDVIVDIAKAH